MATATVGATTKRCPGCKTELPLSEFGVNRAKKDGVMVYCRPCARAQTRFHYVRNRDARRDSARQRKFGVSREQYDEMLARQDDVCAICFQPEFTLSRTGDEPRLLSVDHDHETGNVRGLLCHGCNVALGSFKENEDNLLAAVEYLKEWK